MPHPSTAIPSSCKRISDPLPRNRSLTPTPPKMTTLKKGPTSTTQSSAPETSLVPTPITKKDELKPKKANQHGGVRVSLFSLSGPSSQSRNKMGTLSTRSLTPRPMKMYSTLKECSLPVHYHSPPLLTIPLLQRRHITEGKRTKKGNGAHL